MFLSDLSIKRPVVAIVASTLLVVFGMYAAIQLPVRETPDIDQPTVSINITYTGASAEVVESKIIKLVEDQISGIEGIKYINSTARDGRGTINIEFELGRDIDAAANDVRDQVSRVANRMPEDSAPPIIQKADQDADPIMFLNLSSSTLNAIELSDIANITVKPSLSSVNGVASVSINGERKRALRIWLDRRAMAARGLTVTDIENALRRENVELGAGTLESQYRDFTLRTIRSYQTPADFEQLVIARGPNNYLVTLAEVAKVEIGAENDKTRFRTNGEPTVGIAVVKRPGASTLTVAHAVTEEVDRIKQILPPGVDLVISVDSSVYIEAALKEVIIAVVVAAIMVIAVIYLFLGTMRAAFIPAVTVPISIIATSIVLWPLGFSINILTLLAMVLAIGLVVDDAIIVLENIHRRMKEEGEPPLLAAYRGAKQVGMAVMSTTLVLMAVFVPIALMQGTVGSLFKEFAISMAVAVGCSLFVALTLTPVLCSKILSLKLDDSLVARNANRVFEIVKTRYGRALNMTLDRPSLAFITFAVLLVATVFVFNTLKHEFAPREDRGSMNVQVRAAEGSSIDNLDKQSLAVTEILKPYIESGEIERVLQMAPNGPSTNVANLVVRMAPWEERNRSVYTFVAELAPKLQRVTGAQAVAAYPPGFGRGGQFANPTVSIGGPTYEVLRGWRDKMIARMSENTRYMQVRSNFTEGKPQMRIRIDRRRAADLGVSINTIGDTLAVMMGSRRVTTFAENGEEYYVMLQGRLDDRRSPNDISNIYVRSDTTRELIPLASVVNIEEASYADNLNRFNRLRSINVFSFPSPDYLLGDIVRDTNEIMAQELPSTARITWRGEAGEMEETGAYMYVSFGLALVVVFLVLAAQFESFVHPMVILTTVPLAVFGAVVGLLAFGQTVNIYSQIGIIVLVGLAAKNGILIVEFANQLRDTGTQFREALVEAAMIRLRPIVMTALATCMGALPLVLASGAGYEGRKAIGVVILTGVACSSLITLLIVPVFYQLFARKTGSPGQVAVELASYEKKHPGWQGEGQAHGPAE